MMRRLVIPFVLLALCACAGKDPDIADYVPPSIVALRAEPGEDYSTVRIVCEVSQADGIKDYGILFGEGELRRIPANNLEDNVFSVEVDGLAYSTQYRYQAYIDGGRGTIYSAVEIWTTVDETPPVPAIVPRRIARAVGADAGKVTLTCDFLSLGPLAQTVVGIDRLCCGICYAPSGTQPTLADAYEEAEEIQESEIYTVEITGLTPTASYAFRPYARIGTQVSYGEIVTLQIPAVETEYVDLGLSVLWATCNLGAVSPTETGNVYAWGETEPKYYGTWECYKWCMGSPETLTKYTLSLDTTQADDKLVLDPEDDAAAVNLGGKWRMPTKAECDELVGKCTAVKTIVDGVSGFLLTSKVSGHTDVSIFIPNEKYWTSELCSSYSPGAKVLGYWGNPLTEDRLSVLDSSPVLRKFDVSRSWLKSIRPVRDR